jgi:hypothetical protein
MKPSRLLPALVLVVLACGAAAARADDFQPSTIGIGFHAIRAPLGVRWWIGENHALDLNAGFTSDGINGERLNQFNFQVGMPIVVRRIGRLAAELRPGLGYEIQDQVNFFGPTRTTDHLIEPSLELEAEVMAIDHLGISGGFGIQMVARKPGAGGATTVSWATGASNIAHLGLHLYLGEPQ